jgi:uncharacterized protein (TIGR03435 family)
MSPRTRVPIRILLWLACAAVALPLPAQAPAASPVYDVVSIKPNKSGLGMMRVSIANDGYSGINNSLKMLIQYAYKLQTVDQIAGISGWADSAGFDINAKMDPDAVAELKKLSNDDAGAERRVMMQRMLEERFHLKVHHETREIQSYNLTVMKGGAKLKEADPNDTYPNGPKGPDGVSHGGMMMMRANEFTGQGITMGALANQLSAQVHRLVTDKTGLTGKYDLVLHYQTDFMHPPSADAGAPADNEPSLMTALQEQLGLKLESVKGPVDTIVVDHVEQPTEN